MIHGGMVFAEARLAFMNEVIFFQVPSYSIGDQTFHQFAQGGGK